MKRLMRAGLILMMLSSLFTKAWGADLIIVINTLECSNYYRSAPLLTDLKKNFDIKFIFPEYDSKIAVKYLDQKFDLKWGTYDIVYNDSLYKGYRKNLTSECVYFPNGSKTPLFSFPLSQLGATFDVLMHIPGKIQLDTIDILPEFILSRDMSITFDSQNIYMLEVQFGQLLRMNKKTYTQQIFSLTDSFTYNRVITSVLTQDEKKNSDEIENEIQDNRAFIKKEVSFEDITYHNGHLYIKSSMAFYRKEDQRVGIISRYFILVMDAASFQLQETIPLLSGEGYYHRYGPIYPTDSLYYLPLLFPKNSTLNKDKKYLLGKFKKQDNRFEFIGFDENNLLPEEHTRLNLNYNFLKHHTYKNYFAHVYSRTISDVNGNGFVIKLLPEVDTVAGSKFPEVRTNYMLLGFAVEFPVANFIAKFDDGRVKLFSYDYSNNLPFNQMELPVKIKTPWPEEDFFKFISINSFIHLNPRNQYIVKYSW